MNFEVARAQMLGQQLRAWEVLDDHVLRAFAETPRENFVPERLPRPRVRRRGDPAGPRPNACSRRRSRAEFCKRCKVEPIDDVLVVGTGSGYLTACLARLAKRVTSVDIFPDFVSKRRSRRSRPAAFATSSSDVADALTLSYRARFDAIAVTASVPELDRHFVEMLRPQGRLFIVVGREPAMEARLITLQPDGTTTTDSLFETVLAPLINADRPEPFVL